MARGLATHAELVRAVETLKRRNRETRAELREIRDIVLGVADPVPANFRFTVIDPPRQHAPGEWPPMIRVDADLDADARWLGLGAEKIVSGSIRLKSADGNNAAAPLPTHDSTAAPPPADVSSGAAAFPGSAFTCRTTPRAPDSALRSFVKWITGNRF